MASIRTICLWVKNGSKVDTHYTSKKGRFFSILQACSSGKKNVLFKLRVSYNADGYGKDPKNVSCWGDKKYIQDIFSEFISVDLLRSL